MGSNCLLAFADNEGVIPKAAASIDAAAVTRLALNRWPGDIRELRVRALLQGTQRLSATEVERWPPAGQAALALSALQLKTFELMLHGLRFVTCDDAGCID